MIEYCYVLQTDDPVPVLTEIPAAISHQKDGFWAAYDQKTGMLLAKDKQIHAETLYYTEKGDPCIFRHTADKTSAKKEMEQVLTDHYYDYCKKANKEKDRLMSMVRKARHATGGPSC